MAKVKRRWGGDKRHHGNAGLQKCGELKNKTCYSPTTFGGYVTTFLPLDEAIATPAVIVIVYPGQASGPVDKNAFGASELRNGKR